MTEYGDRYLVGSQREQVSRFRARVMLFVPLAAILFQVYVPRFDFLGFLTYLELPLLVTIYFALMRRSQIGGLFIGAFIGLAQDSLSIKQPLGMFGIVNTLVGYFAASVGLRIDVEHSVIRFVLVFFFYFFHQFLYWVLARGLLGRQIPFDIQLTLLLGLLNAVVGVTLFHFLDKLREPA
jgi:rod shape-determining protein MreD